MNQERVIKSLGSVWTGLHLLSLFTEDMEEAAGQSSVFSEFTFSSGSCVAVCHTATCGGQRTTPGSIVPCPLLHMRQGLLLFVALHAMLRGPEASTIPLLPSLILM